MSKSEVFLQREMTYLEMARAMLREAQETSVRVDNAIARARKRTTLSQRIRERVVSAWPDISFLCVTGMPAIVRDGYLELRRVLIEEGHPFPLVVTPSMIAPYNFKPWRGSIFGITCTPDARPRRSARWAVTRAARRRRGVAA